MVIGAADLDGTHVALATPFLAERPGDLDVDALDRLLARVLAGGVRAVCPTGSTGEGPRLTRQARREVVEAVRSRIPAGIPLIPAPSAPTAADAIAEIGELAEAGADAVLLAPPSYYPLRPPEVTSFFRAVADAVAVPIVLYNIPQMTSVALPPDVVGELARHPRVIGIKDSSRDFEYLQAVISASADADFGVLTGSDTMLAASMAAGAAGAIAASANLVPELGRAIYDAVRAGDQESAYKAQRRLFDVVQVCRAGSPPAGWKAGLAAAGVCSAQLAPPAIGLGDEDTERLATRLRALGVVD